MILYIIIMSLRFYKNKRTTRPLHVKRFYLTTLTAYNKQYTFRKFLSIYDFDLFWRRDCRLTISSMVHTFLYILRVLYLYNIFTNMMISRKSLLPKPVLLKHAASTAMYIIRHYQIAIHAASGIFFCHVQNIEKILCSKMEIIRLFSFKIRLHSPNLQRIMKLCVSL